ncbi:hypothetical protein [Nocardia sp. NPDC049149]|uniref:hypothetical protein n=1 Tax=Nocardia sp. NPDC049149 TaxID=3364315 RepID=UPI003716EB16
MGVFSPQVAYDNAVGLNPLNFMILGLPRWSQRLTARFAERAVASTIAQRIRRWHDFDEKEKIRLGKHFDPTYPSTPPVALRIILYTWHQEDEAALPLLGAAAHRALAKCDLAAPDARTVTQFVRDRRDLCNLSGIHYLAAESMRCIIWVEIHWKYGEAGSNRRGPAPAIPF